MSITIIAGIKDLKGPRIQFHFPGNIMANDLAHLIIDFS